MALSILSIPRENYWLFTSAVLQLLQDELAKADSKAEEDEDDSESEDEEEHQEKDQDSEPQCTSTVNKRLSASSDTMRTLSVDNSSKGRDLEQVSNSSESESFSNDNPTQDTDYFFHVAFTTHESTVICDTRTMEEYFSEPIEAARKLNYDVKLLDDTYVILQEDATGEYNSMRILEMTRPFSSKNIPIFFLSTHFTDIVLVPSKFKDMVSSVVDYDPNEEDQLAERVCGVFKEAGIKPKLNRSVRLLLTGARSGQVQNALVKACAVLQCPKNIPCYFAITRTAASEVSLILPRSAHERAQMGFSASSIIGSTQDTIVPITIDFAKIPLDCTGIVAGVASKLFNGIRDLGGDPSLYEMSYLSMARSGLIMIPKENMGFFNSILNEDISEKPHPLSPAKNGHSLVV